MTTTKNSTFSTFAHCIQFTITIYTQYIHNLHTRYMYIYISYIHNIYTIYTKNIFNIYTNSKKITKYLQQKKILKISCPACFICILIYLNKNKR